ncbi:MAG: hypothetical protein GF401_08290, partial [Chitinivibrionales bacterium]|nr:hypothetical protein [Chitinivibrionales bacterium]
MQKLRMNIRKTIKNNGASALVGVVAVTMLMAFGATALLQVGAISSNNEIESFLDTQARLAAESGVLLGAAWIKTADNDLFPEDSSDTSTIFEAVPLHAFEARVTVRRITAA